MQEQLAGQMQKAAANQEYEKAAELRDLLSDLRRTTKKVNRFERLPYSLPLAIEPERDLGELAEVLGLPAPPERIEGFDISNISGTFKVASLVSFRRGRPDRANYRKFRIKTVEGQDDFASVAEVVRRRYTRLLNESKNQPTSSSPPGFTAPAPGAADSTVRTPQSALEEPVAQELQRMVDDVSAAHKRPSGGSVMADAAAADVRAHRAPGEVPKKGTTNLPDLILIDGGKGQLSAACAELQKLSL